MNPNRNEVVTRTLISAGTVGALALGLSVLSPQPVVSQTAAQNVKVVNADTESIPVRARGTTAIAGTVRLNPQANTVKLDPEASIVSARQDGAWTVRLNNPDAIRVEDVSERRRVPYEAQLNFIVDEKFFSNRRKAPEPGPGRRLVIETVTVHGSAPTGQVPSVSIVMDRTDGGIGAVRSYFALTPQGPLGSHTSFAATHQVRLYCDSTHLPAVTLARNGSNLGRALATVSLSGYTEPE